MKGRPILFSAPMVRAILEGRKTMTRRVVKLRYGADVVVTNGQVWNPARVDYAGYVDCPYGQVSDRLWVRESWRIGAWDENYGALCIDYRDGPRKEWVCIPECADPDGDVFRRYWLQSIEDAARANLKCAEEGRYRWDPGQSPCRWRPSIHMPRWASRITLEVTGVRVERLQEIDMADAQAEGVSDTGAFILDGEGNEQGGLIAEYAVLWDQINGDGSWESNPWVWVIEFKRVDGGAA